MVDDAALRDEVDRVAAAVGLPVVRVAPAAAPARKVWSAASAVVVDGAGARRLAASTLPRRPRVVLVTGAEPTDTLWQAAVAVGAESVLRLPAQVRELTARLAEAVDELGRDAGRGPVVAVIGGHGGAGASVFAAAVALSAAQSLLIDVDPWSGGLDLLLGGERSSGLRWPDLVVQDGRIDWTALHDALPRIGGVSVLSSARTALDIAAGPVTAVVDAARRGGVTVVCDVPRRLTAAAETVLDLADLVVVVTAGDLRACAAGAAMAPAVSGRNPNTGLVVRGPSPGGLSAGDVASLCGLPLLAAMRPAPRLADSLEHGGLRVRGRSPLGRAAVRVLQVLGRQPARDAA
ncbi:hypothetical protein LV457_10950 [Mycobacterium sp. MYCO198283]|uniref:septum site-determining protein Ssd n=1 Tax=Mycobacterium sp. MYCO198283 TaxID=2883505 RepID=UPI001E5E5A3C|nr:hypothetical protein [Mycobacterium sp. MYCO198283]